MKRDATEMAKPVPSVIDISGFEVVDTEALKRPNKEPNNEKLTERDTLTKKRTRKNESSLSCSWK